jgi:hypothetical protein
VADPAACTVSLTVVDESLAKHIGSLSIRLGDLLKHAGTNHVHNTWYLEVPEHFSLFASLHPALPMELNQPPTA